MKVFVCMRPGVDGFSPFDESALEAALRLDGAEVRVVSLCPEAGHAALRELTRLGAKEVFALTDPAFAGSDTLATARVLAAFFAKRPADLILCGRKSLEGETAQVGPMLAALLNVPLFPYALSLEARGGAVFCRGRGREAELALPALVTVERTNPLRFPSVRSKRGEVVVLSRIDAGIDRALCGFEGSPTRVLKVSENTAGRRRCRFIAAREFESVWQKAGEPAEKPRPKEAAEKIKTAFAIGEEAALLAETLAETVTRLDGSDLYAVVNAVKRDDPDAVLWDADEDGRVLAPMAAALLGAGLCADCTGLMTVGGRLHGFRPTHAGSTVAEIDCLRRPAMATVRPSATMERVIVSGGAGIAGAYGRLRAFAKRIGACVGASRALVDSGEAPYEEQIGLTGRSVCPALYVAIGISGALRHMCAVENAGIVVAVNPDRNAPVFDYADYGIVCTFEEFLDAVGENLKP